MLNKLSFTLLFAVLTCGQIASAQVPLPGKCPEIKLMNKFIWPDFQGIWFEYARYFSNAGPGEECVYGDYRTNKNGTIEVRVSGINTSNQPVSLDATGMILGPGLFFVTSKENGQKRTHQILDTDYKSWAVIYNCEKDGEKHADSAWILTRVRNPEEEIVANAKAMMDHNGVSTYFLRYTRQNNCPKIN